ncbi:hypothetical protein [Variovorax sp. GT1P44]|uniref:hypothetical protein n=1 Tax=Variovorax sp. GT1P44 TaxID=3443742 RepID=UPI003F481D10
MAYAREAREIPLIMPRIADGPAGRQPVNPGDPAYEELSRIDPDGLVIGRYALSQGLAMQLSPRVLRVTALSDDVLVNSYFIRGDRDEWALIDAGQGDEAHADVLLASAPGRVRWTLEMHLPTLPHGHRIDLGGCALRVHRTSDREDAGVSFLLEEEKTLFVVDADSPGAFDAGEVEWLAPSRGFIRRA